MEEFLSEKIFKCNFMFMYAFKHTYGNTRLCTDYIDGV